MMMIRTSATTTRFLRAFSTSSPAAKRLEFMSSAEDAVKDIPDGAKLLVGGTLP